MFWLFVLCVCLFAFVLFFERGSFFHICIRKWHQISRKCKRLAVFLNQWKSSDKRWFYQKWKQKRWKCVERRATKLKDIKIQNPLILIMFKVEFTFFFKQTTKTKCFLGQLQQIFNYIRVGCILNTILKVAS